MNRADGRIDGTADAQPWPKPAYAWYVVIVLMMAYAVAYLDRMILSLLIEPIKRDLEISDTQVSLLIGFAFAAFYTLMGLPLGLMSDRYNRRRLIAAGLTLWSLMTAACGVATNFWSLFLARVGVGVGEATLSPAAYSMMSDYFPKDRLARVFAVYSLGATLGVGLAMLVGGIVTNAVANSPPVELPLFGPVRAWQLTFFWVALPGLVIALLMITVREPVRRGRTLESAVHRLPFAELARFVGRNGRLVFFHFAGITFLVFPVFAWMAWLPAFFVRTYGMNAGDVGIYYGLIFAGAGSIGLVLGGFCADYLFARKRADAHMLTVLGSVVAMLPLFVAMPLMPTPELAFLFVVPATLLSSVQGGVAGAALQLITPNQLRAQIIALYFLVVNLIGLGLGPTATALITDYVFADTLALRYSLAIVAAVCLPLAVLSLGLSLKPYRQCIGALAPP